MKQNRLNPSEKSSSIRLVSGIASSLVAFLTPAVLQATAITWNNNGTDFNTPGNWSAGVPGSADAATFSTTKVNDPNLSASLSVGQLVFTTNLGTGYNLTSSNSGIALTLTGTGTGTTVTGTGPAINVINAVTNTISAPIVLGASAGSTQTFRGAVAGANTTINGVISEANAGINLSLATDGLWTFTNANTYTGTTTLNNGGVRLTVRHNQALGTTAAGTVVASGAALQLENNLTITGEALQLVGTGIASGGALRNLSGNNTWAGSITTTGGTRFNSDSGLLTLDVTSGNAITGTGDPLTFGGAGNISVLDPIATTSGTLDKDGAGTLTLTANNTFTGVVTLSGGTLRFNSVANVSGGASALGAPTTVANGTIHIGGGGTLAYTGTGHSTNRVVNLSAGTAGATIDASGSGALVFTSNFTAGNNSKTLTLSGTSNAANEIKGIIPNNSGSELTSINKTGSGTWILSGVNSYTGTTTVTQGKLMVGSGGSLAAGSAVSVSPGAILGGSGTINGSTTISGILEPGASIGTLTVNNSVTWNGNAGNSWLFELGTPAAVLGGSSTQDLLNIVGGNFVKGSGSSWTFNFLGTGAVGWYKLVDWTGSTTFTAVDFGTPINLPSGLYGTYFVDGGTSALYLQLIPEPSVGLLAAFGSLALIRRRR